jgi:hypothetical protein
LHLKIRRTQQALLKDFFIIHGGDDAKIHD